MTAKTITEAQLTAALRESAMANLSWLNIEPLIPAIFAALPPMPGERPYDLLGDGTGQTTDPLALPDGGTDFSMLSPEERELVGNPEDYRPDTGLDVERLARALAEVRWTTAWKMKPDAYATKVAATYARLTEADR
jgi:hypothetical protein